MKIHKQVAKILGTKLGFEDHGIFTALIALDYGDCHQTIGGFAMGSTRHDGKVEVATPRAADFIIRMIRACGVRTWEQIEGRTIFALFEGDHMPLNVMPIGVEKLPTEKGERFLFAEWQRDVKAAL